MPEYDERESYQLRLDAEEDGEYVAYLVDVTPATERECVFHDDLIQFHARRAWSAALEYQRRR